MSQSAIRGAREAATDAKGARGARGRRHAPCAGARARRERRGRSLPWKNAARALCLFLLIVARVLHILAFLLRLGTPFLLVVRGRAHPLARTSQLVIVVVIVVVVVLLL